MLLKILGTCCVLCNVQNSVPILDQQLSTELLWSYTLAKEADIAPFPDLLRYLTKDQADVAQTLNQEPYTQLHKWDLVWLHPMMIPLFTQKILPDLKVPICLLINNSDHSFPFGCGVEESFLNHEMIQHIFVQNCDYPFAHEKITLIPIGLDYHAAYARQHLSPNFQEKILSGIVDSLQPTFARIPRAFVDFQHNDTSGQRKKIFSTIFGSGMIDNSLCRLDRDELWQIKGKYAFSISPHGNGLDCHRTWEDLILGCIVIVKSSSLDSLYEGLPVVIVNDWEEITQNNMQQWLTKYADAFTNPCYREKLTNQWWIKKIKNKIESIKQKNTGIYE